MCTALTYKSLDTYFGRTLDIECSHAEKIVLTPRDFPFTLRNGLEIKNHFAFLGTAMVADGYPMYFDAVNEKGIAVSGLNFPENAVYNKQKKGQNNIASFEFLPYILSVCDSVQSAKLELEKINITDEGFSRQLGPSPLHFMIADINSAITVEQTKTGLKVYENKVGVLTNSPTFDFHMQNLTNYMGVSNKPPVNSFSKNLDLKPYSRGMGSLGLPGDLSSTSRFVRASFFKENATLEKTNEKCVMQFFNIMSSVNQVNGCNILDNGESEYTAYTSCINLNRGIYYHKTYYSGGICAVDLHKENLNSAKLKSWDFLKEPQMIALN